MQVWLSRQQKAFITLGSPVVPLLSTSKADSGLASEFRWDRAIYTAYERMLRAQLPGSPHIMSKGRARTPHTVRTRHTPRAQQDSSNRTSSNDTPRTARWISGSRILHEFDTSLTR